MLTESDGFGIFIMRTVQVRAELYYRSDILRTSNQEQHTNEFYILSLYMEMYILYVVMHFIDFIWASVHVSNLSVFAKNVF